MTKNLIAIILFSFLLFETHSFAQSTVNSFEKKDSLAQFASKYIDSIAGKKIKDNIIAQSNAIQQLYKKLRDDSIAQSNIIQQLYNKITENAITQSNAVQKLHNKITGDSIADLPQPLIPSPKEIVSDSLLQLKKVPLSFVGINSGPMIHEGTGAEVTFDAGQVFSTFKFIDSESNQPKEFTHNSGFGFSLGYRYPLPNELFIRANIGLREAGASMIYEGLNVNWNIQYADANIGLGYMYNKWRLKPYCAVSPYLGYMLKANQLIGAFNYDMKEIKSMKTTDIGLFFSPGLKIALSKSIAFYAEYKYILGLKNLETATDKKSTNRGWAINFGVAVTVESLKTTK